MAPVKSFITGAAGFIGSYLVDFLAEKGHEVSGIYEGPVNLLGEIENKENLIACDIRHKNKLEKILAEKKPNFIYHLAAQSYPEVSREKPEYTIETNIIGTSNLFEAVKNLKLDCRILVAGSSGQYGSLCKVPTHEDCRMQPEHIYGMSKVAQENIAYLHYKSSGIDAFTMRIFNTTGPRKVGGVCADFTRQVAAVNLDLQKPVIKVGDLTKKRAIMDIRDAINGFYLAMEKAKAGEAYNICGPKTYMIEEVLKLATSHCKAKPEISVDESLKRPTDEPVIWGNCAKFYKATGWRAQIPLEKTIKNMVEYWTSHPEKIRDSTLPL